MLQGPGYDAGVTAVEQLEGKVVMTGASGPSLRRAGGNPLTGLNRPTKRRTHRGGGQGLGSILDSWDARNCFLIFLWSILFSFQGPSLKMRLLSGTFLG